jgi:membrane-bound serine protease (ClpP class)
MRTHRLNQFTLLLLFGVSLWLAGWAVRALAQDLEGETITSTAKHAVVLEINGPIGPAIASYFITELKQAHGDGAEIVIAEMDTPGGLDDSMRDMIQAILASPVPVATYVSPSGARAASAGLYILTASHLAAMAPGTNTGSATPTQIGDMPESPDEAPEKDPIAGDDSEDEEAADKALGNDDALRAKVINDAAAYIRSLAEMRGRNADWAESAVREAANLPAKEALTENVIDIVADDVDDLLQQADGRIVETQLDDKTLETDGLSVVRVSPGWLTLFLAFISNPNVAFIFMSIGTTGIIIEMWNPGSIFPGVLGVVSLIIAFYSFQVLPVNWAGAGLLLIGVILVVAEAYTPSLGLLGLFGLILFVIGALLMFPSDAPGFSLSPGVVITATSLLAILLGAILFAVVRTHGKVPMIGSEATSTRNGVVIEWDGTEGYVLVEGEQWKARSQSALSPDQEVEVTAVNGLILDVRPKSA